MSALVWLGTGALWGWFLIFSQAVTVSHFRANKWREAAVHMIGGGVVRFLASAGAIFLALQYGLAAVMWMLLGFGLMRAFLLQRVHSGQAFQKQIRC